MKWSEILERWYNEIFLSVYNKYNKNCEISDVPERVIMKTELIHLIYKSC